MKQTSVIGDLGFDIFGGVPAFSKLVQIEIAHVLQELRFENDVDTAALFAHGARLLAGGGKGGIGIDRR
jgi:hypothetical protein